MKLLCDKCGKPIKRSVAQNNYWWVCMTIIGNEQGNSKEDQSIIVKHHFGWYRIVEIDGVPEKDWESSSDWNKQVFSERTTALRLWSAEQGIYIPTPKEYFSGELKLSEETIK